MLINLNPQKLSLPIVITASLRAQAFLCLLCWFLTIITTTSGEPAAATANIAKANPIVPIVPVVTKPVAAVPNVPPPQSPLPQPAAVQVENKTRTGQTFVDSQKKIPEDLSQVSWSVPCPTGWGSSELNFQSNVTKDTIHLLTRKNSR